MGKLFILLFYAFIFALSCSQNIVRISSTDNLFIYKYTFNKPTSKLDTSITAIIFIKEGFSYKQIKLIHKSINIWNESSNKKVLFYLASNKKATRNNLCHISIIIKPILSTNKAIVKYNKNNKDTSIIGLTSYTKCKYASIYLVKDKLHENSEEKLIWLTLHELGHAIGLSHVNSKTTIMNYLITDEVPCYNGTCCLTKKDMSEFCDLYKCNVEKTKYCQP